MDVAGLVDVHVDDLLLILVNVLGPLFHTFLVVPTSWMHSGWVSLNFVSQDNQGAMIVLVLVHDRGQVEIEFAMHVGE